MEKEFVPYELAVKLKELGFNEPCFAYYRIFDGYPKEYTFGYFDEPKRYESNIMVFAPTFSQAFRWFREKYNLFGCIDLHSCIPPHWFVRIDNIVTNDYVFHSEDEHKKFTTYEEAELACLTKLIEIVEQTKN